MRYIFIFAGNSVLFIIILNNKIMQKKIILITLLITIQFYCQKENTIGSKLQTNAAEKLINTNLKKGLTIGGYAQIDYNQKESDNGILDVHRFVLLFGYKFSDKVQFVSEIEYENVKEVFVEQAFLNYTINDNMNLKAGLMLVPMGIINEYHEPTTFNGVERPSMDKSIVPTTWREIGVGVSGRFDDISLKYQAFIFNGFSSVNGTKVLGGSNGLRNGRQKGAKSTINTPTISIKIDYYGIAKLRLGISGYFGKTQPKDDVQNLIGADVGINMVGLDARYFNKKITARGQFIYTAISNTFAYNLANSAKLGSRLQGFYIETAYNLLPITKKQKLDAFVRYEKYDTHHKVATNIIKNQTHNRNEITFGLTYHIANGAVFKADYQIKNNAAKNTILKNQFNLGVGIFF